MRHEVVCGAFAIVVSSLLSPGSATADDAFAAASPESPNAAELKLVDPDRKCETQTQPVPLPPHPNPPYPDRLRRAAIRGRVTLQGVITVDGSIRGLSVVGKADPGLARIALSTVSKWRYKPALCDGRPVETFMVTTETFQPF